MTHFVLTLLALLALYAACRYAIQEFQRAAAYRAALKIIPGIVDECLEVANRVSLPWATRRRAARMALNAMSEPMLWRLGTQPDLVRSIAKEHKRTIADGPAADDNVLQPLAEYVALLSLFFDRKHGPSLRKSLNGFLANKARDARAKHVKETRASYLIVRTASKKVVKANPWARPMAEKMANTIRQELSSG